MRCLSVQQPSAWAICAGLKNIVNRSWNTNHRGRIAIQASLERTLWRRVCHATAELKRYSPLMTYGVVIGVVDIVDVQPWNEHLEDNRWAQGPYCWTLANAQLIPNPIPINGNLNLDELDLNVEAQLERQLQRPPHQVDPLAIHAIEPHLLDGIRLLRNCK